MQLSIFDTMQAEKSTHLTLHILRNPYGWHADEVKAARLHAADLIEELTTALEGLVNDVAQYEAWQRPCHALDKARAVLAKVKD